MTQSTTHRVLYALFCLCREDRHVDAAALGKAAGLSTIEAGKALLALEREGLADASRARLTMLGLSRAARLQASGAGGPRIELRGSAPRRSDEARALPIAARGASRGAQRPAESSFATAMPSSAALTMPPA